MSQMSVKKLSIPEGSPPLWVDQHIEPWKASLSFYPFGDFLNFENTEASLSSFLWQVALGFFLFDYY